MTLKYPVSLYRLLSVEMPNSNFGYVDRWCYMLSFKDDMELKTWLSSIADNRWVSRQNMRFQDNYDQSFSYFDIVSMVSFYKKKKPLYVFRNGPVPLKRYKSRIFRTFNTFQEEKINNCFLEDKEDYRSEYGTIVKGRIRKLPDSWDDTKQHTSRSWKKYRKTQYKNKD